MVGPAALLPVSESAFGLHEWSTPANKTIGFLMFSSLSRKGCQREHQLPQAVGNQIYHSIGDNPEAHSEWVGRSRIRTGEAKSKEEPSPNRKRNSVQDSSTVFLQGGETSLRSWFRGVNIRLVCGRFVIRTRGHAIHHHPLRFAGVTAGSTDRISHGPGLPRLRPRAGAAGGPSPRTIRFGTWRFVRGLQVRI